MEEGNTQAQAEKTATAAPEKQGADIPPTLENASLEDMDAVQTAAATRVADSEKAGKEGDGKPAKAEEPEKPAQEEPAKEEPEKPAEPVVEEPAKAEVPTEPAKPEKPEKPEEPEATGELPERFRFRNPNDKAIAAVKKAADAAGKPITWAEAEKRVVGEPQVTETPVDPVSAAQGTIETLTDEIANLEKQIDPESEDEILSTKEQRKATVRLSQARAELTEAKLELRDATGAVENQRRTVQQKQATARQESKNRAIELYPDAADGETALGKAIAQRFEEMKNPSHPDHPILYADTAPERIAKDVAAELGIAPKPKASTAKPTPPAAIPPKKATPPSGAKTAVAEKPAEVTKDKKSVEYLMSDEASLAELDEAFGGNKGIAAAVR